MAFKDKDIEKVYLIKFELENLKRKHSFIKQIKYISDTSCIGLRIYHPYLIYMLHPSAKKEILKGFDWEGEFVLFKNDLAIIKDLYKQYDNIEIIIPISPGYAFIKYQNNRYGHRKKLLDYNHEVFYEDNRLITRIKRYISELFMSWFWCYKPLG